MLLSTSNFATARRPGPYEAMLALAGKPGMISLADGHPDPALLPAHWVRAGLEEVASALTDKALQYGPAEGLPQLREASTQLLLQRGVKAGPDNVLITTGSQQAIDMLTRVLVEPGNAVAVECFNHPAALQALRFAGAALAEVPADAEGMDVDRLEAVLQASGARVVYIVPNFPNPTGAVMPLARRLQLLDIAVRHNLTLIEDDPYGELWFGEAPPPSLAALNQQSGGRARVAYMTSYSRVVAPALRLGVLLAPANVRRAIVLAKQAANVHTGSMEQLAMTALLQSGRLAAHLADLRPAYAAKARALVNGLRRHCEGLLTFSAPAGGMFIWARLDRRLPALGAQAWADFGLEHRVLVVPGNAFSITAASQALLRLSFANSAVSDLQEGAARLGRGLQALMTRPGPTPSPAA
jgi:2-aminoadipate transaminase